MHARLWGPAEFVGFPRMRQWAHAAGVGALAVTAVAGPAFAGMWWGPRLFTTGEAGLLASLIVVGYLLVRAAGRALVGAALVLGVWVALISPQLAGAYALAHRGSETAAVVRSVQDIRSDSWREGRFVCTVLIPRTELTARVRHSCTGATEPGALLDVIYDPDGRARTRSEATLQERGAAYTRFGVLAGLYAAVCVVSVIRARRLRASRIA